MKKIKNHIRANRNIYLFILVFIVYYFLFFAGFGEGVGINSDSSVLVQNNDLSNFHLWTDYFFGEEKILTSSCLFFNVFQYILSFLPLAMAAKLSLFLAMVLLSYSLLKLVSFDFRRGNSKMLLLLLIFILGCNLWFYPFRFSQEVLIYGLAFLVLAFVYFKKFISDPKHSYINGICFVLFFSLLLHPSIMMLGFILLFMYFIYYNIFYKMLIFNRNFIRKILLLLLLFILASSYYIIPILYKTINIGLTANLFTTIAPLVIYEASSQNLTLLSNIIMMDHIRFINEHLLLSILSLIFVSWILFINLIKAPRSRKKLFTLIAFIVFLYFSLGSSAPLPFINKFFIEKIPFFDALRQPARYLYIVMVLTFVLFYYALIYIKKNKRAVVGIFLLLLIIGSLSVKRNKEAIDVFTLPKSYTEMSAYFKDKQNASRALVFPYIPYLYYKNGATFPLDKFFGIPFDNYSIIAPKFPIKDELYKDIKNGMDPKAKLSEMGVTHVIFHKDYNFESLKKRFPLSLEDNPIIFKNLKRFLNSVAENNEITVFKVNNKNPYFETLDKSCLVDILREENLVLNVNLDKLKTGKECQLAEAIKINPVHYELSFQEECDYILLNFKTQFHKGWKLFYPSRKRGKSISVSRFIWLGYFNGFLATFENPTDKIIVYFEPQKYYLLGTAVSIFSFISLLSYIIWLRRKDKNIK